MLPDCFAWPGPAKPILMGVSNPGKQVLRQQMLNARQALPLARRRQLNLQLSAHLLRYLEPRPGSRVAAFHAVRGEPDLRPALESLDSAGFQVHLPILIDQQLQFRRWTHDSVLTPNRYGIPEPLDGKACRAESLDCVLTPLVAFSADGARLGMGGGYYDRTFAFRLDQPSAPGPQMIGIAYSLQQVDSLPLESWDVPLDAVITERGLLDFRPGASA